MKHDSIKVFKELNVDAGSTGEHFVPILCLFYYDEEKVMMLGVHERLTALMWHICMTSGKFANVQLLPQIKKIYISLPYFQIT